MDKLELPVKKGSKYIGIIGFLTILLFASLVHVHTVRTSPDSAWYMSHALNIYNGHGYVDTDQETKIMNRGPLYPLMIALSYKIFGVSVESALLVSRLFFILNVLIIYLLAMELSGTKSALLAAFLYLSSSIIYLWLTFVKLDTVWPFFLLLGLWLLVKAFKQDRGLFFGLSGLCIAVAYLVKEVNVAILPLPVIYTLWFHRKDLRKKLPGLAIFYICFFLPFSAWAFYTYLASGSPYVLGVLQGRHIKSPLHHFLDNGILSLLKKWLAATWHFYVNYFHRIFHLLGILFVLSYCVLFWRALVKKNKNDGFLFLSLVCFFPVALFTSLRRLRPGQVTIIYFLSFIALAHCLFLLADFLYQKVLPKFINPSIEKNRKTVKYSITALVLGVLLCVHFYKNGSPILTILMNKHHSVGFFNIGGEPLKVEGWHTDLFQSAGEWVKKNVPEGQPIMCDWFGMRSVYFFSGGKNKMFPVPLRYSDIRFIGGQQEQGYGPHFNYYKETASLPLYLWVRYPSDDLAPKTRMFALCEDDLFARLEREGIDYVMVTPRRNFMTMYFEDNPCFERIAEFEGGKIKIYKVNCTQPVKEYEMKVADPVGSYLKRLAEKQPRRYRFYRTYLESRVGLSAADIEKISGVEFQPFQVEKIYHSREEHNNKP
jgi:4-amino-4-deoxy-L-arabinose transferase-like glycosyltransferase